MVDSIQRNRTAGEFFRGEGILPLFFERDEYVAVCQSEVKVTSRRKGRTPSPPHHLTTGFIARL